MSSNSAPCLVPDPCQNHHCKHGKVCEVDDNNSPMCVCQDPSSCPSSTGVFEKVSGEWERGHGGWGSKQGVEERGCGPGSLGHANRGQDLAWGDRLESSTGPSCL